MTTSTAPATTYPATSTAARYDIVPGDWIVAGTDPDGLDFGQILGISDDGETADVAWSGGVRTPCDLAPADVQVYVDQETAERRCEYRRDELHILAAQAD
jgi:hypothetical protein